MTTEHTPLDLIHGQILSLREVFKTGKTYDVAWRKRQLWSLYLLVKDNEERIYEAMEKDMKRPKEESIGGDVAPVLEECLYFLENLDRLTKDKKVKPRMSIHAMDTLEIRRDPRGVVLIIGTWNFPLQLSFVPLAGAIAAGNVAILKLSELRPFTSALMTELFLKYMDRDCFHIVNGDETVTTELLKHQFDHIFYTGNSKNARIVMKAASHHLTPVTLELGGKSPAVITSNVDMKTVANRIAFGKLNNAGQICVAVDYVLCQKTRVSEFIEVFCNKITERYGVDPQKSKDYTRIISVKHLNRLENLINNCHKGTIVVGGQVDKDDLYCAPTVLTGITMDDEIMKDEIFGPILPVIEYDDLDSAIAMINKTAVPLALYVFSRDNGQVERVLKNTRSGGVCINDCLMHQVDSALPFGGVGESGIGNYQGDCSYNTFTHERAILRKTQRLEYLMKVRYPPYGPRQFGVMRALLVTHPIIVWFKMRALQCKITASLLAAAAAILWQRKYFPADIEFVRQMQRRLSEFILGSIG